MMNKNARFKRAFLTVLREVFLEREVVFCDCSGDVFADEAEVPRFVVVAGDGFFFGRVAEDETELSQVLVDFGESFGVGEHFFVVVFDVAVGFDNENVDGETGVVFGVADFGEVFFAVVGSEFRVGGPSVVLRCCGMCCRVRFGYPRFLRGSFSRLQSVGE